MACELNKNHKCQVESPEKIMVEKIGGTNKAVRAFHLGNVSLADFRLSKPLDPPHAARIS